MVHGHASNMKICWKSHRDSYYGTQFNMTFYIISQNNAIDINALILCMETLLSIVYPLGQLLIIKLHIIQVYGKY